MGDEDEPREVEVDSSGNLYVISASADNSNNWLLLYNEAIGNSSELRVPLSNTIGVPGPTAMLVSGDKLYLAQATDLTNPPTQTTSLRQGFSSSSHLITSGEAVACEKMPVFRVTGPASTGQAVPDLNLIRSQEILGAVPYAQNDHNLSANLEKDAVDLLAFYVEELA